MTADPLREAAVLMRERAEAATDGGFGWRLADLPDANEVWANRDAAGWDAFMVATTATRLNLGPGAQGFADAVHIASWHPLVALAVADWLDDIATRHAPNPEPVELVLHYDEDCPTGECEDPGYHDDCIVCSGCYPSYEGMDGHALYPCRETVSALAVARVYLGRES